MLSGWIDYLSFFFSLFLSGMISRDASRMRAGQGMWILRQSILRHFRPFRGIRSAQRHLPVFRQKMYRGWEICHKLCSLPFVSLCRPFSLSQIACTISKTYPLHAKPLCHLKIELHISLSKINFSNYYKLSPLHRLLAKS